MKQSNPDKSFLSGPTNTTSTAPGSTPTYTSPNATVLPTPVSQTSTTSTAPAPTSGTTALSTEQ